ISLIRGPQGYGFTVSGSAPVHVSHVEPGSPAHLSGVRMLDIIIKIDQINVSKSSTEAVVRMFRMAPHSVLLTLLRQVGVNGPTGPFCSQQDTPLSMPARSSVYGGSGAHSDFRFPPRMRSSMGTGPETAQHRNSEITMVTNNL
ncbi:hypothetical protein Ciccas_012082, partial [Cichlidogyrus casuarinus]